MAETVGSLADKLTIIELKIYHMREQGSRAGVDEKFRQSCADKLAIMRAQRDDLVKELTTLIDEIASGRARPKVYRQFKMYNDAQYRDGGPLTPDP